MSVFIADLAIREFDHFRIYKFLNLKRCGRYEQTERLSQCQYKGNHLVS